MCFESSGGLLLVVIVPSGITLVNLLFVHSAFLVLQYSFNLLSPISLLAKIIDLSLLYKLALDSKAQIQKNTGQSRAKRLLDSCIFFVSIVSLKISNHILPL